LHRIPANLIAQHLQFIAGKEKITLEPAAAHAIARGAEGGLRDAESMLDQLVAFCGETIAEADVLNVFGFTSEQTVVDLTGHVLRSETAGALELLYQQCESGKDMMRLMSDLIGYLRDLLVFKAKPDALSEDVDLDLQKSLAAHAELIATDRLLELIDQFAAAEGRMKWAPNKKLHFEVALIRAIQSLNQATLDEVIENLSALRGGKMATAKEVAIPATGVSDPGYNRSARVAEQPSQYNAPESALDVDPARVWEQLSGKIPTQKAFLRNSAAAAHVLGTEGRNFLIGFAPDQRSMMDILGTQTNRKFLETLLHEITGKDWTMKLSVREELRSKQSPPSQTGKSSRAHDFKDDPLIQEAIEMFKAEIKS
jgi:DNA polymerase-3 subunit gamma/tau